MTKLSGDNDNFVNNKAFEKKKNDMVFQHIREVFNIKKRISKENIITNIMLKYKVKAVNTVTNHVSEVTNTVSSHGKFILEQTQYNEYAENEEPFHKLRLLEGYTQPCTKGTISLKPRKTPVLLLQTL